MPKLNKTIIENIRNHGDKIEHKEQWFDAVRDHPGEFIGYIGNKGHINCFREIFHNAMDELEDEESPCDRIRIEYYESTRTTIVIDNGRGIPYGKLEDIFASQFTSGKYTKKAKQFTAGMHGVGGKVTNALSSEFFVSSFLCKEATGGKPEGRRIEFREGIPWDKGGKTEGVDLHEVSIPNKDNYQGSVIEFRPSTMIIGEITTTCEDIMKLISNLTPLMKLGAIVDFHGVKLDGLEINKQLVNQDGIVSFLICKTQSPLIAPIVLSRTTDTMKADIAFTYDSSEESSFETEDILSFANTCPTVNTTNSTHVSGFLEALGTYFRNYMNKFYINNKSKTTVINNDIKAGLIAVVSVKHLKPIFSGQAKEIFSNRDIVPFIKELMSDGLDEWCKTNSSDLQKVCRHFKDAADLRLKQDKDKVTMVKKYNVSAINGLPAKYLKPNGKEHLELVIVEGDSAKAPCSTARDAERQGIFPVRGKVANAMAESEAKFFGNEECQGIRDLLGSGYGRKFDLDKCKFEKIIIMCDADLDGLHIRTLLLKMFLVYYRAIVEDGRLYSAVPPLYYANIKGKFKYFIDKLDFVKYVQSRFGSDNKVFDANNNQISQKDLTGILCRNSNYRDELKVISDTYAVDPFLLEYAMSIRNLPFDKFKKAISKKYRFLNTYQENGITILDGLVGEKIHTVIFNQNFVDACSSLYHYIDKEADKYIINGEPTTLYGLMDRFEAYKPPNVQRYKGLGEMNPLQLRESTLHPDYDRVLLRYTTEDIKREIEEIREVECNKALLLKDADIAGFEL